MEMLQTKSSSKELSQLAIPEQQLMVDDMYGDDEVEEEEDLAGAVVNCQSSGADGLVLDLPSFVTGLSDDDLRETAYEILLASVEGAGGLISSTKEKLSNLMNVPAKHKIPQLDQPTRAPGLAGLLETMRIQMEISDAADKRIREALLHAASGKLGKRMDTVLLPLELISVVFQEDFPDKENFLQWEKRQLKLLEEGLIYHPGINHDTNNRLRRDLSLLIESFTETLSFQASLIQHAEALKALRRVAVPLAGGMSTTEKAGGFCHWADGYHLNVCIYEMLLRSVFSRSGEGQMVEEVEEILELIKSTWRVLGITQIVHDTCYTWLLFQKYVWTGKFSLLLHATQQMKMIASAGQRSAQEKCYMKSLKSAMKGKDCSQGLTYLQSVLMPIKIWADKHLEDYHLHFYKDLDKMDCLLTITIIASQLIADEIDQLRIDKLMPETVASKQVKTYILSSLSIAFEHVLKGVDAKQGAHMEHPLALLAKEVQALAKRDALMFIPILSRWHPQAQAISASLIHCFYHKELKPFVDRASTLTNDVEAVFPAAYSLEKYLNGLVRTISEGNDSYWQEIVPYQVEAAASNLIVKWIDSELLKKVSDQVEYSISHENWEPISDEYCCGNSVIEVFEAIQEAFNQFFCLKLPMGDSLLTSLVNGIDSIVQVYANDAMTRLGSAAYVAPLGTNSKQHKFGTVVRSFFVKKHASPFLPERQFSSEVSLLSIRNLCVCLNSLHYLSNQMDTLEENIKDLWCARWPLYEFTFAATFPGKQLTDTNLRLKHLSRSSEGFFIGFESSRKSIKSAIEKICECTGTKIILLDLRELFLDSLQKASVSQYSMLKFILGLDKVLGQICEILVEPLREQVVIGLLEASLNGVLQVLLYGDSSQAFSQIDGDLLAEYLSILKNLFTADGYGLPKQLVENMAAPIQKILDLYKVEASILFLIIEIRLQVQLHTMEVPLNNFIFLGVGYS